MKSRYFLVGLGLLSVTGLHGQVHVDLVMDQAQYLPREAMLVGVRITNQSGRTLRLGEDDDWLRLVVETYAGKPVTQLGDVPVKLPFTVENSQVATRLVDLAPYYPLDSPGRFRVTAIVKIKQWNEPLTSPPKDFEIVKGSTLWEQEFGVPGPAANNQPPEVRKFSLIKATYLKQMVLYVRLSNPSETQTFRVFSVAPMVTFSRPEAQLDQAGQLHILCQTGARSFRYCVISPDGQLIRRQNHEYTDTRPSLRPDGEGHVRVAGGVRVLRRDDVPPPLPTDSLPASSTNLGNTKS